MLDYLRFRYRRALRRFRRDVTVLRQWLVNYIDRHIWGKWHQLGVVRRFLLVWLGVMVFAFVGLWQQYNGLLQAARLAVPEPGGIYTEAAVGTVKVLNPVLPESTLSNDINRLIFSGLTRYNQQRQVVPDLAERWDVSADGRIYTFHLRRGVKWHDDVPFTADDVEFTLAAIQNPDSRSPLASSWQGVQVEVKDPQTITFILPTPLASFLDSTTLAIVPRHQLEGVEPSQLREAKFNREPIGTGPFKLKTFAPSAREVALSANNNYYGGRPKIDEIIFRLYDSSVAALQAYAQHQVLSPGRVLPEQLDRRSKLAGLVDYNFLLPTETVLFFNTTDRVLADQELRTLLARLLNREQILNQATGGQGLPVSQPLLPGMLGYTAKYAAAPLDPAAARQALDHAGWRLTAGGDVRQKNGRSLRLRLVTAGGGELERAADAIKQQWGRLGIEVEVVTTDLTNLQQTYMRPRNFQLLLFGLNLGADPDIYPFWHSSQTKDPGVNLSGYVSAEADKALEAARLKVDPLVRVGKYEAFLQLWNADAPAVVLYGSSYQYAVSDDVAGIAAGRLVTPADRFYHIERWTVRRRWVDIRP